MTAYRILQVVLTGLVVVSQPAVAGDYTHDSQETIFWKSENNSRAEIPTAISRLYTSLYNTRQLPLTRISIDKGQTVEQALRAANGFIGPHFPIEVDSLLCDLNSKHCSRRLIEVPNTNYDDLTSHAGGFEFSKGSWTIGPGDYIVIPNIQFEEYEKFAVSWKNSGESIQQILDSRRVTCEKLNTDCYSAIELLNQSNPKVLRDDYEGKLVLPTRGVSALISLQHRGEPISWNEASLEFGENLDATAESAEDNRPQAPALSIRQHQEYESEIDEWEHTEERAFKAIEQNSVTWGDSKNQSGLATEPHFNAQSQLFTLIKHPALDPGWQPGLDWSNATVAILDSWVDQSHCDIGANVEVHNEIAATPPATPSTAQCGQIEPANPVEHHGTHVTALISGSLNDLGIGGLLPPESKVYTHEVKEQKLRESVYRDKVSNDITSIAVGKKSKTFNLSWFYTNDTSGIDVIKDAIEVVGGFAVVVAPAGNGAQDYNAGGCPLFPACLYKYPNVITVVGLDRDEIAPQIWTMSPNEGSSFANFFHVGAIAEDVLSATKANKHGRLSGTSQAAPQVSATVGYLWAMLAANSATPVRPQQVKNRIIYTSDIFPHLQNKLQGGRLNMTRALAIERTYASALDGREVDGTLDAYRNRDGSPASLVILRHNGQDTRIDFGRLKRLVRQQGSSRFVAYYTGDDGSLVRLVGVDLMTRSQELHIFGDGDADVTRISMMDLTDYISDF